MTQQSFTLTQVINICVKVAPNATIAEVLNAINAETACDNAPQSQTRETAPTAPTAENDPNLAPAIVEPERNDAPQPKKPTKAELAAAYNRIQAYATHNGKGQLNIEKDMDEETESYTRLIVSPCASVSERKWNAISLSIRKAIETLGGYRMSDGMLAINASAWAKAKKAAKKAAK